MGKKFDTFYIYNVLEQGDALLPTLLDSALVYSIRKIEVNHGGFQWDSHCQLVVYADGFNLLDENVIL
jgi:hypothetical protein